MKWNKNQLNIDLILLSKVWSSKLSILMAWKYSFGSKYPFAIRKVCLKTSSYITKKLPWFWRHRSTWYRRRHRLSFFCWLWGSWRLVRWWVFRLWQRWVCSSSFCRVDWEPRGCFYLGKGGSTFLEKGLEVLEVFIDRVGVLHFGVIKIE